MDNYRKEKHPPNDGDTNYMLRCSQQHDHLTGDLMLSCAICPALQLLLFQVIIHFPQSVLNVMNVTDLHSV